MGKELKDVLADLDEVFEVYVEGCDLMEEVPRWSIFSDLEMGTMKHRCKIKEWFRMIGKEVEEGRPSPVFS